MEAVGQLAAGVAHNFNNLLQVTMGYTDMLLDEREDALVRSAATEIRRATERGAALTRQLLAFGRKHDPRVTRVELGATIAALGDMLARVIREDIQLTMDLEGTRAVLIDPHDLEQVIFNLVINARDALPRGGRIHSGAGYDDGRRRNRCRASRPSPPVNIVRLRVRDNGIGMTADVQAHLFEPFFTTKEIGEGTGLGLAFVQGVAHHAGGFVTIDTAPQQGTTVSMYLPPYDGAPDVADTAPPLRQVPSTGPATILLVEDEAAVREMATRLLERAGYTVLAASTPSEACAIFEAEPARISLLVTDIVMPGMHGPVLAERLVSSASRSESGVRLRLQRHHARNHGGRRARGVPAQALYSGGADRRRPGSTGPGGRHPVSRVELQHRRLHRPDGAARHARSAALRQIP